MLKIKIGEVCDVYDEPHATPKKIDKYCLLLMKRLIIM